MRKQAVLWSGFLLSGLLSGCAEQKPIVKPQSVVAPVPAQQKVPEEFFAEGVRALRANDHSGAEIAFAEVVSKSKDAKLLAEAHYNLGLILLRKQELAGAQKAFEEVLKLDPQNRDAFVNLGAAFKAQQKYASATDTYRKALQVIPRDPLLMNNLIVIYRLDKNYREAEKTGHRLLARAPTNVEAYKNMTLVYYDQGKWEMAELLCINAGKMLEKQRQADPSLNDDPAIYNNLGVIYARMGRFRDAVGQFNRALAVDPNYVDALINVGASAHRFRDYARAIGAYERVLKLQPENGKARRGLAFAVFGAGDTQKAIPLLNQVLERNANDDQSVFAMGVLHDSFLHDFGKAVTYYERYRTLKGAAMQASDPVVARLEAAKARLQMASEVKQENQPKKEEKETGTGERPAGRDNGANKRGEETLEKLIDTPDDGTVPAEKDGPGKQPPKPNETGVKKSEAPKEPAKENK